MTDGATRDHSLRFACITACVTLTLPRPCGRGVSVQRRSHRHGSLTDPPAPQTDSGRVYIAVDHQSAGGLLLAAAVARVLRCLARRRHQKDPRARTYAGLVPVRGHRVDGHLSAGEGDAPPSASVVTVTVLGRAGQRTRPAHGGTAADPGQDQVTVVQPRATMGAEPGIVKVWWRPRPVKR